MTQFKGSLVQLSFTVVLMLMGAISGADAEDSSKQWSEEELRQIQTAQRFLSILERNPRRGTALDRVYGHHGEFGTLDTFMQTLRKKTQLTDQDGAAWMLLGLFESQRGNDADAIDAFLKAEPLRQTDAMVCFYLGQSQLRVGQAEQAVASFERAIKRNPPRADMIEIYQNLGRVHQRAQRTDQALAVWKRLEALFPDDARVLEQIAVTLAEEGQYEPAVERYDKLVELVTDDYRRVTYRVASAELRIKMGQREEGIASMEEVLANLNPDGWLHQDVRRRIDDVFLRSGDQDGLVKYYQAWLKTHPEDVGAMARLSRFLASSARVPESIQWMEKAIQLAPSRADLRKSFIDQLVEQQRFSDAIVQYERLVDAEPSNPDFLRDWGKLVLRDKQQPEAQRQQQAIKIWNRMLTIRPEDALTASQVADLFRQHKMNEQAESLYRKAVALAPDDPQYREYLGEFLHINHRSDEALVVWSGIAADDRRTAANVTRLAEVYNSFGYSDKAVVEIADAVKLDPKDVNLQLQAAKYHSRVQKYDQAIQYIDAAQSLAENDDQRESVMDQRIEVLQAAGQIDAQIAQWSQAIQAAGDQATSDQWYRLARFLDAEHQFPEAMQAIERAIELNPKSILTLTLAARIAESSGNYGRAAQISRTLAETDRRSMGEHLMSVARLESALGRSDEALKVAQELIVSAPGNTEYYEFYAEMCFRYGKTDQGLDALRKAVRISPNEPALIIALGGALANQLRTDEAIEVYWRAFEKSEEVEDKVTLTTKLTELYQQINELDQLIDRFERGRRQEDQQREMTICLAQAWHTVGDDGAARHELESLLTENTRDTHLLHQLSSLCEDTYDLDAAIGYQRRLVAIAPGAETEQPLAMLLMKNAQVDEASEIFAKLTEREEDPVRQIRSIDSLLNHGGYDSVIEITGPLLTQDPNQWELMYREAVALHELKRDDEAKLRFEQILALELPFDSLSKADEESLKKAQAKAKSDRLKGLQVRDPHRRTPYSMLVATYQVHQATSGASPQVYYQPGATQGTWAPTAYGEARIAALGWLMKFEDDAARARERDADDTKSNAAGDETQVATGDGLMGELSVEQWVARRAEPQDAPREAILDALYVARLNEDHAKVFEIARRLAKSGQIDDQRFFLGSMSLRSHGPSGVSAGIRLGHLPVNPQPLSDEDLQLAIECYESVRTQEKDKPSSPMGGSQVFFSSNGRTFIMQSNGSVVTFSGGPGVGGTLVMQIVHELEMAGKSEKAWQLYDEYLQQVDSVEQFAEALQIASQRESDDKLMALFRRWHKAALKEINESAPGNPSVSGKIGASPNPFHDMVPMIQRHMDRFGGDRKLEPVLELLDMGLEVSHAYTDRHPQSSTPQAGFPGSSGSGSSPMVVFVFRGGEPEQTPLEFPPNSRLIDSATLSLMYQALDVFKRNGGAEDLVDHLRKRLSADDASGDDASGDDASGGARGDRADAASTHGNSVSDQLYLASVLWWMGEKNEAADLMARIVAKRPEEWDIIRGLVKIYQSQGEFQAAMTLVDATVPRDQSVLQWRELLALDLAERLGDTERARKAAQTLFGLRLPSDLQIPLIDKMRRLGMHKEADALLARAERTSGNQTSALLSLMMRNLRQGNMQRAEQLAQMILQRTRMPMSSVLQSSINSRSGHPRTDEPRTKALRLLKASGRLDKMIEQLESQYERSPTSVRLVEQLIEYYTAIDEKAKLETLLVRAVEQQPKSPNLRIRLAEYYTSKSNSDRACDQYMAVMEIQPAWVLSNLQSIDNAFANANRKAELADAICACDLRSNQQIHDILRFARELLNSGKRRELGTKLYLKLYDEALYYRTQIISELISSRAVLEDKKLYEIVKQSLLPTPQEILADPWTGLGDIRGYTSEGFVITNFEQFLQHVKQTDQLVDLTSTIKEMVAKHPQWLGGKVLLALVDMNTDHQNDGRTQLQEMLTQDGTLQSIPPTACWILGQLLNKSPETQSLALSLYERAAESSDQYSGMSIEHSPVNQLVESYAKEGRRDDARRTLTVQLERARNSRHNYDPAFAAYQSVQDKLWVTRKFLSLKLPVDAFLVARDLQERPDELNAGSRFLGGQSESRIREIEQLLASALEQAKSLDASQVVARVLSVDPSLRNGGDNGQGDDNGEGVVDLMLLIPDVKSLGSKTIQSLTLELLMSSASDEPAKKMIDERLTQLADQHPQDLAIAIAQAAWRLQTDNDRAIESVQRLESLVSEQESDTIDETDNRGTGKLRQRREAMRRVPLWIVARQCLKRDDMRETGNRLAEIALVAASVQLQPDEQASILHEWGDILIHQDELQQAEDRWGQLLELATRRPNTFGSSSSQAKGDKTSVPPLTLSQFHTVIALAKVGAKNDMTKFSVKAIRDSLKGGIPVPDPPNDASLLSQSGFLSPVNRPVASINSAVIEDQVVGAIQEVFQIWAGKRFPDEGVFEVLMDLVLPSHRPTEIRMYVTAIDPLNGVVDALGGRLVDAAEQAGALDKVRDKVKERSKVAWDVVSAEALQTLIAIKQNDQSTALAMLDSLHHRMETPLPTVQRNCALLVALQANKQPELRKFTVPMMRLVLEDLFKDKNNENATSVLQSELARCVIESLGETDDPESIKSFFDWVQEASQPKYARYSGTYGLYQQARDLATIAQQTSELRQPMLSLDLMARVSDSQTTDYSTPALNIPLTIVANELSHMPPQRRYEIWHQWTLPSQGAIKVRFVGSLRERHARVPDVFASLDESQVDASQVDASGTSPSGDKRRPQPTIDYRNGYALSNFNELVNAAKAAGKLDELQSQVETLVKQEVPDAAFLLAIIYIEQGDLQNGTPLVDQLLVNFKQRNKDDKSPSSQSAELEYLLFRTCAASEVFSPVLDNRRKEFIQQVSNRQFVFRNFANADWAARKSSQLAASDKAPGSELVHWITPRSGFVPTTDQSWWDVFDGQIVHLSGQDRDSLIFRYPLTGNFSISMDCFDDTWAESDTGYGGAVVRTKANRNTTYIASVDGNDGLPGAAAQLHARPAFNRVTIKVHEGEMEYWINGYLVYHEPLSKTYPWFSLNTDGYLVNGYRNFSISGTPTIPDEVELFADDRMDGWSCSHFGQTQPRKRIINRENRPVAHTVDTNASQFDWSVDRGILTGKRLADFVDREQGWLRYERPMVAGDTLRYEFLYEPERTVAHPTLGRIAMILEPDGVKTHWITDPSWDGPVHRVAPNNALVESECQRSSGPMPLKVDDWNQVEMTMGENTVSVRLNGTLVFERPVGVQTDTHFGLFRYENQASKVRSARLSGDWPAELPADLEQHFADLIQPINPKHGITLNAALDDLTIAPLAAEVAERASQMPDDEAFEYLKRWVLPSQDHDNLRLYFTLNNSLSDASLDGDAARMAFQKQGEMICPAMELARVAKRLSKLNHLQQIVNRYVAKSPTQARNQAALLALFAIESGNKKTAKAAVESVMKLLSRSTLKGLDPNDRAAEMVVAARAAQEPDLLLSGLELANMLRNIQRTTAEKSYNDTFNSNVHALVGSIESSVQHIGDTSSTSPSTLTQWTSVPYLKPSTASQGSRPSLWEVNRGVLMHYPAQTGSQLFFQSPLQGKFEIVAEVSTAGFRDLSIGWGMHAASTAHNLSATSVSRLMHSERQAGGKLEIPGWSRTTQRRIQVDGNQVTTWVNNVQIHQGSFDTTLDPWVVIQSKQPIFDGLVSNLRILGKPTIPTQIDLINMDGWAAWRADIYGESHSTESRDNSIYLWQRVGDELTGRLRNRQVDSKSPMESLMLYQRPMLEDGVIEYEFWYEPGTFEVFPALGPDAFLIRPDGVSVHRLTNAQFERSDLAPDNEAPLETSAKQIDLKTNDWNKLRLELAGDEVKLIVNDSPVGSAPVRVDANRRQFGLFRYSDKTQARVRNLIYQGDWPKTLPEVNEQDLAFPGQDPFNFDGAKTIVNLTLKESIAELKSHGLHVLGPAGRIETMDQGMRMSVFEAKGFSMWPVLILRKEIAGDVEFTVDYEDLSSTPVKTGWGHSFGLNILMSDDHFSNVSCSVAIDESNDLVYKPQLARRTFDGKHQMKQFKVPGATKSGRLRLVRSQGIIHCLVAPAGQSQFRLIDSYSVGDGKIKSMKLQARCSDEVGRSSIVFSNCVIRALAKE